MAVARSFVQSQPTRLLGRAAELAAIVQWLSHDDVRLLSLTGPAGVGKTRLALEAGDRLAGEFVDGVVVADLAPTRDPALVLPTIARALGLDDSGSPPLPRRLRAYLSDRHLLLVLDTFEQLLPAAGLLADLLAAAPRLRMLVTSRMPLRLRAERSLRISPLPTPGLDTIPAIDSLLQNPAVALFVERAQALRADFVPTDRDAALLVRLVDHLDSLPLAIELAAAQMQVLPLRVITHRLEQHAQALRWDAQDLPDRQRSLAAAVGWSYELLSETEKALFRHLGVFVGRVSLDAIASVLGEADEDEILAGLSSLAEKSLIVPGCVEDENPEPAFGMLETMREYAWERLRAEGELDAARSAHARYFLGVVERTAPELLGSQQREAFLHLARELDNLRLALRGLLDRHEQEGALRLVISLGWFWFARGHHNEGWRWLEETLAKTAEADPILRARALARAGLIFNYLGELDRARSVLEQADTLAQASPDPFDLAEVRTYLGARDVLAGDETAGVKRLRDQLEHWRRLGDGRAAFHLGYSQSYLAAAAIGRGELGEAASLLTEGVAWHESRGDGRSAAVVRCRLAVVLAELGEQTRALQLVEEGVATSILLQDRLLLSVGVEAALIVVKDDADALNRARLLGGADALSQATGLAFGILGRSQRPDVGALRDLLQQTELDAAYREGRTLSFDHLAERTLELLHEASRTVTNPQQATTEPPVESLLSAREQDVLRLVAEGLTSKEIGKRLFLSPRTVEHHLTSIFNKLGVDTRAQAAAVATRDGLV